MTAVHWLTGQRGLRAFQKIQSRPEGHAHINSCRTLAPFATFIGVQSDRTVLFLRPSLDSLQCPPDAHRCPLERTSKAGRIAMPSALAMWPARCQAPSELARPLARHSGTETTHGHAVQGGSGVPLVIQAHPRMKKHSGLSSATQNHKSHREERNFAARLTSCSSEIVPIKAACVAFHTRGHSPHPGTHCRSKVASRDLGPKEALEWRDMQ